MPLSSVTRTNDSVSGTLMFEQEDIDLVSEVTE